MLASPSSVVCRADLSSSSVKTERSPYRYVWHVMVKYSTVMLCENETKVIRSLEGFSVAGK